MKWNLKLKWKQLLVEVPLENLVLFSWDFTCKYHVIGGIWCLSNLNIRWRPVISIPTCLGKTSRVSVAVCMCWCFVLFIFICRHLFFGSLSCWYFFLRFTWNSPHIGVYDLVIIAIPLLISLVIWNHMVVHISIIFLALGTSH